MSKTYNLTRVIVGVCVGFIVGVSFGIYLTTIVA